MRRAAQSGSAGSQRSLVQLATRGRAAAGGRLLRRGIGRGLVTVKLAGVKKEEEEKKEESRNAEEEGIGADVERRKPPQDPCDKEVVLSALRQKR